MRTVTGIYASVAVAAGLASCGGGQHAATPQTPASFAASIVKVEKTAIPRTAELYGTVEASRSAAVSSRVMATVTAVKVREGDAVAAGQVLVEIDPQTALGQESQARGALAQARAALALAERNHERFKALHAKGAASDLELDMARMQYEQAKGAVEQGSGAVEAAASVARESKVVAPFAGRVAAKLVEVGDLAAPGRPLVVVESATGRRLVLSVPESLIAVGDLKLGQSIPVRIDALPGNAEITGKVVEMAPGANPATHTFAVRVELGGPEVASGMAGRAWLQAGTRTVIAVPAAALLQQGGVSMVAIRDEAGKARSRAVSLGATLPDGRREVLAGLAGGEDVLVGLAAVPADGAPVEAQP